MQQFIGWILTINSADEDARRRGRNVVILALGLIAMAILFVPVVMLRSIVGPGVYATIAVAIGLYAGVVMLARRGLVTLSALLFIATEVIAVLGASFSTGQLSVGPFFLVLALLIASLTLRPWQIWPVLAAITVGLFATIFALSSTPFAELYGYETIFGGVLLLVVVALISFLGAKTTTGALRTADQARAEAERAAEALGRANLDLETAVGERTAALEAALHDVQAHADQQAQLLAELEQQRSAIRELSVPVIPVSATTLIMPLVGALDSTRLVQVQERALEALQRASARTLILDITGVPIVDTQVAQGLLMVVQAARLLGAGVVLVGIRPEVAQSIVGLGLDLHAIETASDLQSALKRVTLN